MLHEVGSKGHREEDKIKTCGNLRYWEQRQLLKNKEKISHKMFRKAIFQKIRRELRTAVWDKGGGKMDGKGSSGATRPAETKEKGTHTLIASTEHESGSVPKLVRSGPSQPKQRQETYEVTKESERRKSEPATRTKNASPQPHVFSKKHRKLLV